MYTSIDELQQAVTGALRLDGNTIHVTDGHALRETNIDPLVFTAVFAADPALKTQARSVIRHLAAGLGFAPHLSVSTTWRLGEERFPQRRRSLPSICAH